MDDNFTSNIHQKLSKIISKIITVEEESSNDSLDVSKVEQ